MKKIILFLAILFSIYSHAQVGIGISTANSSAALDVSSTSKGVLFPRMTQAQRTAMDPLPAAAQGLMVYQTDGSEGFYYNTSISVTPNWLYLPNSASTTPSGTVVAFAGTTAPSGSAFCNGQAISRSTYASLFSLIGTTHGAGNGSTTFNVPDLRGRTAFGHDVMGASAASRLTSANGIDGSTLGATGGTETKTVAAANLPSHTHSVSLSTTSDGAHTHDYNDAYFAENGGASVGGNSVYGTSANSDTDNSFRFRTSSDGYSNSKSNIATSSTGSHSHTVSGNTGGSGSGTAFSVVNPGIVLNYIIKL